MLEEEGLLPPVPTLLKRRTYLRFLRQFDHVALKVLHREDEVRDHLGPSRNLGL